MVNNIYYPHKNLNKLPEKISLASTRTRVSDSAVGFAGPLAPLSNMHEAPYTMNGEGYKSVEQGHFHSKAKYAKNEVAAQAIMDTDCAFTARSTGKAIHAPGWEGIELPNLKNHMREKYLQNPPCMKVLMETGTKKLLELTWDKKWAAGYGPYSRMFEKGEQPAQNLTGYTLEELRTEFRDTDQVQNARQSTPLQQRPELAQTEGQSNPQQQRPAAEVWSPLQLAIGSEVRNTHSGQRKERSVLAVHGQAEASYQRIEVQLSDFCHTCVLLYRRYACTTYDGFEGPWAQTILRHTSP